MNTKLLIFIAWLLYFAVLQTADDVLRFYLVYTCVLVTCALFYNRENKSRSPKNKKKAR